MKAAENGGIRGFDANKTVKTRKRPYIVDTIGLVVGRLTHRLARA